MSYVKKIRDAASYRARLHRFLSDRCLLFNPYTVSDRKLWDGVMTTRWRGVFSLTQMVVLRFVDVITEGPSVHPREWVGFRVGDSDEEIVSDMRAFTGDRTAADSLKPIRNSINGRPISRSDQIMPLVGKTVFVSRNIITVLPQGRLGKAMAMHRLKGKLGTDAAVIRAAAVQAKFEMLNRLLTYAKANVFLDGIPDEPVDIYTPIAGMINHVLTYPSVIPPTD